ncbi:MAG: ribose-phosphate pyrophosphokinase [Chlamydiales bacterium]|nr:ribose-phosphate pyrophosphokinase [Chlamydiales bacterium]
MPSNSPSNLEFMLFAGSSHPVLSGHIADCLGVKLSSIALQEFPDGESSVRILDNVRGKDVFVVQSIAKKPNSYLMELLIIIDALKRASAKSIVAIIPYFGYARQDRKDKPRVPITAKLVANLLETAGAMRVLTMDLHAGQIQGFFDIPVDNLFARPALISAIRSLDLKNMCVVAPDLGSVAMGRTFAHELHADLALIDKRRVSATNVLKGALIGDVSGKDVVIVDDMCTTGSTLVTAAEVCRDGGARHIYAAVSHGVFVKDVFSKLDKSFIERLFVSDTISLPGGEMCKKLQIQTVSVAELFAKAIRGVVSAESISSLFEEK